MAFNAVSDLFDRRVRVVATDGLDDVDTIGMMAMPEMEHECRPLRKFI